MQSFELSDLSIINSTHSLVSLDSSIMGFSALLTSRGWRDLNPKIYAAELADQAKEQRFQKAVQSYITQPDSHHGWELMGILQEAQTALEAEYTYAKKQQVIYQAKAEQEIKSAGGFVADWTQWFWHAVQDFFGSSSLALAEKYAQTAVSCRDKQADLSSLMVVLQQTLLIGSTLIPEEFMEFEEDERDGGSNEAEEMVEMDTMQGWGYNPYPQYISPSIMISSILLLAYKAIQNT